MLVSLEWGRLKLHAPPEAGPSELEPGALRSLRQVELVRWTQSVGLTLVNRDLASLQLRTPSGQTLSFHILQIFPFTSESKRMGIIVRVSVPV